MSEGSFGARPEPRRARPSITNPTPRQPTTNWRKAIRAILLATLPARAGDGTWDGGGTSAIWGGNNNWNPNAVIANGASFTANFGIAFPNGYNITVNTARTIGHIVFTDPAAANDMTLVKHASDYILTLDVTNGAPTAPTINVTQPDRTLTIFPRVGGSDGLTKLGPGTLTLSNANLYTGPTTIQAGILALGDSLALQNSVLDTANSLAGDTTNGLKTLVPSLTLGGLSGNKDLAPLFTTTAGGYAAVTDLTLNPGTGVSATYSGKIADGVAGMLLTKSGDGTQTLGDVNTYTGATMVNVGTLKFTATAAASASTTVTVAVGATLGVLVSANNGQWVNSGDLNHQGSSTLVIDYGSTTPSTSVAPIKVANLSVGSGSTLQVTATSFSGLLVGQSYPLITWTGNGPADASAFATLVLARRITGNLSVSGNTLYLTLTANAPGPLSWNVGNGAWNTTTSNWVDGASVPTAYEDLLDSVRFDDAAGVTGAPIVTLDTPLSPVNLTMNSSNHNYTLSGAGGLTGATTLTLDAANTRTLTLATANTHSGANTINGGTLVLSGVNSFTGPTTVNTGATLRLGASDVIPDGPGVGNVTVNAGATLDLNTFSETLNSLLGSGTVDTLAGGTPTLTLGSGDTSSTFSGVLQNSAGTLNLAKTGTGTFTLAGSNTFSGTISIQAGTLAMGAVSALGAAPSITMAGGAALTPTLTNLAVNAPITLGDAGTSSRIDTPLVSLGTTYMPFTLNGPISGAGDLTLNGTIALNTIGTIILNAQSTYTGSTLITCNPNSNAGVNCYVQLGTNNALPATTVLTLDGLDGGGSGRSVQLDLNGFNQTLAGLLNVPRLQNRRQRIVNTSAVPATLTVTNASDSVFSGDLGTTDPANGNFSLVKGGNGLLSLSGAIGYTGDTTVNAGTLEIAQTTLANNNSTITVATNAILQLDFAETDSVGGLVLNGVVQPPGVYNSTTSAPYLAGPGSLQVLAPPPPPVLDPTTGFTLVPGTSASFTFSTVAGYKYRLLSSLDVSAPLSSWTGVVITTPVASDAAGWVVATDVTMTLTDLTSQADVAHRFYRIQASR